VITPAKVLGFADSFVGDLIGPNDQIIHVFKSQDFSRSRGTLSDHYTSLTADGPKQTIYDRATKSELASDFTAAFRLYLAAANAFLHLSRSATSTPTFQVRCKANAGKALERAEKIKKASEKPGTTIEVGVLPINWFGVGEQLGTGGGMWVSNDTRADQQSYVLRKSSTVNNIRYPLWTEVVPLSPDPNALYSYA
jgi:calpain-7